MYLLKVINSTSIKTIHQSVQIKVRPWLLPESSTDHSQSKLSPKVLKKKLLNEYEVIMAEIYRVAKTYFKILYMKFCLFISNY